MSNSCQLANLRLLLWQHKITRSSWLEQLADWTSCEVARAEQLLRGEQLTTQELERLKESLDWDDEVVMGLRYADWLEQAHASGELDVLVENLKFLLEQLEWGKQEELAVQLGVSSATVSRWNPVAKSRTANI
jgi:plasmid maintenance system antidote protein VapI